MKVYLCIPVLNRYDLLEKCIISAEKGTLAPDKYIIMDNGCKYSSDIYKDKVEVLNFGRNVGCASSWNYFIKTYDGIKIISNDDIEFFPNTIENMVKCYIEQKDNIQAGIFFPSGNAGSVFSCFSLSKWCVDNVGLFDENFYPAYYEDNDYVYRMHMKGTTGFHVPDCGYTHLKSSTLEAFDPEQKRQHDINFSRNRMYFISKWGGDIGHEKFKIPFGKGE